jgi:hypothetical protein
MTKVLNVAQTLKVNADDLMSVMASESGITTGYSSDGNGAVGLIQFTTPSATQLGTTVEKLSKMTAVKQLDYVDSYFSSCNKLYCGKRKGKIYKPIKSLSDLYTASFIPYYCSSSYDDSTVICAKNGPYISYYTQNASAFDHTWDKKNKRFIIKGYITKSMLADHANSNRAEYT